MTDSWILLAAFTVGLAGSGHCLGMCGGIAGAFQAEGRDLLLYNAGRLFSYVLAGTLAGAVGLSVGHLLDIDRWTAVLRLAAGGLIVATGIYLLLDRPVWPFLEGAGRPLWRLIGPLIRRHRPVPGSGAARWLGLGMLWGWLPCGMVYSMLMVALVSGTAVNGALVMLSFALGTLPAMLATGFATARIGDWAKRRRIARYAGGLCLAAGLWTAVAPALPMPAVPAHPLSAGAVLCEKINSHGRTYRDVLMSRAR